MNRLPKELQALYQAKEEDVSTFLLRLAQEETMAIIAKTSFQPFLWYKRSSQKRQIEYFYHEDAYPLKAESFRPGNPMTEEFYSYLIEEMLMSAKDDAAMVMDCQEAKEGVVVRFVIYGVELSTMIHVSQLELKGAVARQEEMLHSRNHVTFSVPVYPMESDAADHVYEIIRKMELISDMEHYAYVYHLLKHHTMEGMLVWNRLDSRCKSDGFLPKEQQWDTIVSYKDDNYMRNKWDKYKKRHDYLSISWDDLILSLHKFISPIWKELSVREAFTGDWMPEIERFL